MVPYRQLSYAVAVANQGGVQAASEKIAISQPALSNAIQKVEKEYGLKIFIRDRPNKLALTSVGRRFIAQTKRLIENAEDLFNLPFASTELGVLTVADIAKVRRTFKDATRYSYSNGSASISLNVNKRKGANLVESMEQIDAVVERIRPTLPPSVTLSYINNTAPLVLEQNLGLQGNMATAMVLVLIVVIASVGVR